MRHRTKCCAVALWICFLLSGADWLRFRGPNGSGVALDSALPTQWNDGQNVAWRTRLPGRGISSPIVVGDRVLVTCCTGYRQDRLHIVCFHTATGQPVWERQFWATGRTMTHPKTCTAASTPASDGEHIFAYYSSNDLVCVDRDGNLIWLRSLMPEFPNASNSLGLASSPIVVDGVLIVKIDTDCESLALGLDCEDGVTQWKANRPSLASWTSPVELRSPSGMTSTVVLQSGRELSGYDPRSGRRVWRLERGCSTTASSVVQDGVIYVPSNGLVALRQRSGDHPPEPLWQNGRLSPSTASPLCDRGYVYAISRSVLKCADAKTGKVVWQLRLKGNFSSSPVVANGHLYVFNEDGLGQIIDVEGGRGRVVGEPDLGETILASPAVANGALYVRSDGHLWKITN